MRMGYGLIILVDLIIRSQSFTEHYTEQGAFPLAALFTLGLRPDQFSLHAMSGSRDFEVLLFVLHGLFAVGLFLGWRTRLMTVFCYLMAVSLQNRNFLILNGGDNWMRIVLFWAIFLPWGDRFSIDSLRNDQESPNQLFSVAGCGLILQVMAVYFVSALYKTGPAWRTEGSAAYLSLKQLEWNSDLGLYLLYFPKFLVYCSFAVALLSKVSGLLFFRGFPLRNGGTMDVGEPRMESAAEAVRGIRLFCLSCRPGILHGAGHVSLHRYGHGIGPLAGLTLGEQVGASISREA